MATTAKVAKTKTGPIVKPRQSTADPATVAAAAALAKAKAEAGAARAAAKAEKDAAKAEKRAASDAKKAEREAARSQALVSMPKQGALSTDVGPAAIAALDKSNKDEQKANELLGEIKSKRYDVISNVVLAIKKAAEADDSIDLASAFSSDIKRNNKLNDQIGLALGYRTFTTIKEAGQADKRRIVYAPSVLKYFPGPKDSKDDPNTQKKATLRSNFSHLVKKAAQGAQALIDMGSDVTVVKDEESGTLLLTGPAIAAHFGNDAVLLNEKQTVGEGEEQIKLTEKPSFTAIAAIAAEARGAAIHRGSNTRGAGVTTIDPEAAITQLSENYVRAVEALPTDLTEAMRDALASVASAIDKVM